MQKQQNSPNIAQLGLTASQLEVYNIIKDREAAGTTTTSADVAKDWGKRNRSYVYRVIAKLVDVGLIERYGQRYYRLFIPKPQTEKET